MPDLSRSAHSQPVSPRDGPSLPSSGTLRYDFGVSEPVNRPTDPIQRTPLSTDLADTRPLDLRSLKAALSELKTSISSELKAELDRKLEARLGEPLGQRFELTQRSQPILNCQPPPVDSNTHRTTALLCDKYYGSSNTISAQEWLDIFQAVTCDWSDRDRVRALPRHLTEEALQWFSLEVVPDMQTITWIECRQRLIARFGQAVANPIVQATNRRLSARETVSNYYNEKRRLLVQAGASEAIQVALLTSGMPESYLAFIASQSPQTTADWIRIALLVEQTKGKRFGKPNESAFHGEEIDKSFRKRSNFKSNRNFRPKIGNPDNTPSTPCPICTRLGIKDDVMHWKRVCPRKDQETKTVVQTLPTTNAIFAIDYIYVNVRVNAHSFRPFLDTGSKITGMSSAAAQKAGLRPDPITSITIRQVDGLTKTLRSVTPRLTIGSKTIPFVVHVFPNFAYDMLLGIDAALAFRLKIDLSRQKVANSQFCEPLVTTNMLDPTREDPLPDTDTSQHLVNSVNANTLDNFLNKFDVFSKSDKDIGRFRDVQHVIRLQPNAVPVHRRPYRLSPAKEKTMRKIISELLDKGLIKVSRSPWAVSMFLVPKRVGDDRPVCDYRPVNLVTIPEREPVPIIRDVIDRLCGSTVFTVMDVTNAYWHLSLHKDSQEITSFVTPFGQYEWTVLPFGLRNAVSAFQREMRRVLEGFIGQGVEQYLDDLIVHSKSVPEHYALLERLFAKLTQNSHTLRMN